MMIKYLYSFGLKFDFKFFTKFLKITASALRFYLVLFKLIFKKRKSSFFIFGLPKSGSTLLEHIIKEATGNEIIMPVSATLYEQRNNQSHFYTISKFEVNFLKNRSAIIKLHSFATNKVINIFSSKNIPIVVIKRDLLDVRNSHIHYVKNTKFHPEHKFYKNLAILEAEKFWEKNTRQDYEIWLKSWNNFIDNPNILIVDYDDLINNKLETIKKILIHYSIKFDDHKLSTIIKNTSIEHMRKNSPHKKFFRGSKLAK